MWKTGREPCDLMEKSRVLWGSLGLYRRKVMGKNSFRMVTHKNLLEGVSYGRHMADFGTPAIMFEVILVSDINVLRSMNYSTILRALSDTEIQVTGRFAGTCGDFS